ncbi:hypothetical protein KFL_005830010 [Klebsormidium nitens]|uniref:Uncharacterized protein n=1 Tax=Klebsormidium nitens TaxID=105231 RepID=A0A1Y1IH39_KLENI|nr:hypothetical protein KFL_005830010 [Klebsormidium nitens]|eukprot:GAQ89963.1 hypothetical protein KFL_005830010 [Klebsormidium nitens]
MERQDLAEGGWAAPFGASEEARETGKLAEKKKEVSEALEAVGLREAEAQKQRVALGEIGSALAKEKAEPGQRREVVRALERSSASGAVALERLTLEVEKPTIAGFKDIRRAPLVVRAAEQLRILKAFAVESAGREAEVWRATEAISAQVKELTRAYESEVRKISDHRDAADALLTKELRRVMQSALENRVTKDLARWGSPETGGGLIQGRDAPVGINPLEAVTTSWIK